MPLTLGLAVSVGVNVGDPDIEGEAVCEGVRVGLAVLDAVRVALAVGVTEGDCDGLPVGATDALPVCEAVQTWLGVPVEVGLWVVLGLAVPLYVCVILGVGAALPVPDPLGETVLEGVELGDRVAVVLLETLCVGDCVVEGVGLALGDCVSLGVAPLLDVPDTLGLCVSVPLIVGVAVILGVAVGEREGVRVELGVRESDGLVDGVTPWLCETETEPDGATEGVPVVVVDRLRAWLGESVCVDEGVAI